MTAGFAWHGLEFSYEGTNDRIGLVRGDYIKISPNWAIHIPLGNINIIECYFKLVMVQRFVCLLLNCRTSRQLVYCHPVTV